MITYIPEKNNKANICISVIGLAVFALSCIIVEIFDLPDVIWQSVFFLACDYILRAFD